jgi:hypothetical protein
MDEKPDLDREHGIEYNPTEFYLRKKERPPENISTKYFIIAAGLLFLTTMIVVGFTIWYLMQKEASLELNGRLITAETFINPAAAMPQFKSKDQKIRLTEAVVAEIEPRKIIVVANNRRTTVLFDDTVAVAKMGNKLSLDKYEAQTDAYLKKIQFGTPNGLYVVPDTFEHVPATLQDIKLKSMVTIVPAADSPDGDTAKAASIVILQ